MKRLLVLGYPTRRLVLRYIFFIPVDGLADVVFKDILSYRRKTGPNSWPSCYV
jgi:hypothetical protein